MRLAARTTIIAGALAIAAITAPAASARFDGFDGEPQHVAPSGSSARLYLNPVPASGYGSPATSNAGAADIRGIQAQGARVAHELAARDAAVGSATVSSPPPLVIKAYQPNGFDWGDAGIGAAGGLVLSVVGVAGAVAVSRHRNRRTPNTTALIN
jgi:hypothetical protein